MKLSVRAVQQFTVPKNGNSEEENDDAYCIGERLFAIADGATEASFSERWAHSLVEKFVVEPPLPFASSTCEFARWLEPLQHEWEAGIDWQNLPWFAESKARAGAFATFIGMEFFMDGLPEQSEQTESPEALPSKKFTWRSMAVGDSCVFHVRDNQLLQSFPLTRAEEFNSRPILVSTNPQSNDRVWENVFPNRGEAHVDDRFFLATDALAHWFLVQVEAQQRPWETLSALKTIDDFKSLVAQLREDNLMRNDDTTLLTLHACYGERPPVEPPEEEVKDVAVQVEEEQAAPELSVVAGAEDETPVVATTDELTEVAKDETPVVATTDDLTEAAEDDEVTLIRQVSDKE